MRKVFLVFVLFIAVLVQAQENFYFNYARCEIMGVFNGELIKRESKSVRAGLDNFTHDFIAVVNFNDFEIKNKITGENIDFEKVVMQVKGQIPLDEMRDNNKQIQNYKAELEIVFPDETMTSLFDIEVQFFSNGGGFRVVRMKTELDISAINNEKLKDFENKLFIEISYNIYKLKDYY